MKSAFEKKRIPGGDWYVKAPGRRGIVDSPILPAAQEEQRKANVCENLSFVVSREAFPASGERAICRA